MRILHRGINKQNLNWIEGYYFRNFQEKKSFIIPEGTHILPSTLISQIAIEIAPESLGVYTNIDSFGIKIFSGDIIEVHDTTFEIFVKKGGFTGEHVRIEKNERIIQNLPIIISAGNFGVIPKIATLCYTPGVFFPIDEVMERNKRCRVNELSLVGNIVENKSKITKGE